jgi:hypothetical protein
MEVKEHFYADDPAKGPADAKTTLPGVEYFFLGNGLIQAAVQVGAAPPATPVGLLITDPERLGPKRRALTFDRQSGLAGTQVSLMRGRTVHRPAVKAVRARWLREAPVPSVEAAWRAGPFRVSEIFYCPDRKTARLIRRVTVTCLDSKSSRVRVTTGVKNRSAGKGLTLRGAEKRTMAFEYGIVRRRGRPAVALSLSRAFEVDPREAKAWAKTASCRFSDPLLDRFFSAAKFGLRAAVSKSGRLDGGIWQYSLEWVRDQAFIAMALVMSGQAGPARTILDRLLGKFVSEDGATMDSSRLRSFEESEFDQNGVLLFALETYINWTGDTSLLAKRRAKIVKAAEFPLRKAFRHRPSGLLMNRREFWERHGAHGIRDGMELAHQLFVSMGLQSAARLAKSMGDAGRARSWAEAATRLRKTMLGPGRFSLVEAGRLIKRRDTTGAVQEAISPLPESRLPAAAPLFERGRHLLNPDSSAALPIAWEFIDPSSRLACRTLASLEILWNQRWTGGGYGRYHVTSEPDSPGPWPFASLFIARARFEAGDDAKVRRVLDWLGRISGSKAGAWFEFYGPRPVPPYPQVGVVPWVWAEMLFLIIHHMLGVRPSENRLRLRPRLIKGLRAAEASLPLRGGRLELSVRKARRGEKSGYKIGGRFRHFRKNGIEVRLPAESETLKVEAILP